MLTNSCLPRHHLACADCRIGASHDDERHSWIPTLQASRIIWKQTVIAYNTGSKNPAMSDAVTSPTFALPSRRYKIKKAASIGFAALGFLLVTLVVVPHFVDLGLFKRTYLPRVEEALNRRIDVDEVRLSLIPTPSIRMSSLKIFDSHPGNAGSTFFSAQQVQLRLRFWPLMSGRFEVSELVLDKPTFNLVKQPDGTFNYSDIAEKKTSAGARRETRKRAEAPKASSDSTAAPLFIPGNLRVRDGQLNVISKGETPVNIKGIDLSLRDFSSDAPFPFQASFSYPGLKTISLTGDLDYQEEKALVELKNNILKVHDLTLPLQGSISNLSATLRFNLNLRSNNVDAKPIFQVLSVFGLAPRDTEVAGPMDLYMNVTGPLNSLVTQVRGLFKDVKVHGKRALKGTLTGDVSIRLPVGAGPVSRRLQGNGKLVARDGELTNVDLIKKVERVTGMIGLSKDEQRQATTFQTMETDFVIGGGYAEFTRLYLINPQMEVTGGGTMTIEQPTLNLTVDTALSPQASTRAGRGRVTTFFKDKQGRIVVPLKVVGPVENPSVDLNAGKLAETGLPQNAEKGFSSFFKRLFRSR
jgi:AsmA protein